MRSISVDDERGDIETGHRDHHGQPDPEGMRSHYEYPALDAKPGFWDGKWSEFKSRLSASMAEKGCALIIIGVALIVVVICAKIFGWR